MSDGLRQHRRRHLSVSELDLWREVTKTINPLHPITHPLTRDDDSRPVSGLANVVSEAGSSPQATLPKPLSVKQPPLAPIEPRLRQRLRRGRTQIDFAIDLHGHRQDEAHQRLHQFLREAQSAGAKIVLVITGKGRGSDDARDSGFGVLRRSVPHWLREPTLRHVVIGFEEATMTHGGSGALYVRIRRASAGARS